MGRGRVGKRGEGGKRKGRERGGGKREEGEGKGRHRAIINAKDPTVLPWVSVSNIFE